MTHCKISAHEFISNIFSPTVGVICSPQVDVACQKNNLSFVELVEPFSRLSGEATIKDTSNTSFSVKNLRVNFINVKHEPPQPAMARKYLNSSVSLMTDAKITNLNINGYNLEIPSFLPWFDMWRETFFEVQYPAEHEFLKYVLACIIVVSSNEEKPMDSLSQMLQNITHLQTSAQSKYPKWFNGNTLRYFVVLHDAIDGNEKIALETIDNLKQTYGTNNCFLLKVNSRPSNILDEKLLPDPWSQFLSRKIHNIVLLECNKSQSTNDLSDTNIFPNNVSIHQKSNQNLEVGQEANEIQSTSIAFHPLSPDADETHSIGSADEENISITYNINAPIVHGACLSMEDIEQLKLLLQEFFYKSLLPYIEKQIQQLYEIISNRKGVSRSLFSATKRWFTPNKLGSTNTVNSVIYSDDSPELQLRKLADLYFMFGHYNMAFQMYHSAKRDFNADQAWLYYAGALEMSALSAYMCSEMTRKTYDYMEESIVTYLYTCRLSQFATRATLLSTECLKENNQFGEAAHQYIRMTSEESDLRSALLLEQAAYCFLQCSKPRMLRKYAFHIILAGHRYSKCSQRKHSLRCYRQAYQIYSNKGWSLAEDHIYFTIGRHSLNLKQLQEAKDVFSKLLTPFSKQNAQSQANFLKEYLITYSMLNKEKNEEKILPILPIPILNSYKTKVLVGPQVPFRIPGRVLASGVVFTSDENNEVNNKWLKLEQIILQETCSQQMLFKPLVSLFTIRDNNSTKPVAIVNEPIKVLVHLHNPLKIIMSLKEIYLLWQFITDDNTVIENENVDESNTYKYIKVDKILICNLAPNSEEKITLTLTPYDIGKLVIKGICYTIVNNVGSNVVEITGKQRFCNSLNSNYSNNIENSNSIFNKILTINIMPAAPCLQVSFSEINQELLSNELQNITIELRNSGTTSLHKIIIASSVLHLFSFNNDNNTLMDENTDLSKNNTIEMQLPPHFNQRLEPGQCYSFTVSFRAPSTKGTALIDLLFYYENINPASNPRYRLVKHFWHFSVQDSLEIDMNGRLSYACDDNESLTVSMKIMNSNHIHHAASSEIELQQISLISCKWKLFETVYITKELILQSQESVHLLLKAQRLRRKTDSIQISEYKFLNNLNSEKKQQSCYFKENNFNTLKENYNTIEAIFILKWQAQVADSSGKKRLVVGQHYVPLKSIIRPTRSKKTAAIINKYQSLNENMFSFHEAATYKNQLIYIVAHSPIIQNNFQINKICIVPVTLILYNRVNSDLILNITTIGMNRDNTDMKDAKSELFNPSSSNCFRWIGHCKFVRLIKSLNSYLLNLRVAIVCPGTYDLGQHIIVLCKTESSDEFNFQSCRIKNALIVQNISKK